MSNPITHVEQFDGSLGALVGVDPIRYAGGLWLEESTENICRNPDFASDASSWVNNGAGAAVAHIAGGPLGGNYGRVIASGAGTYEGISQSLTSGPALNGQVWTGSALAAGASGGEKFRPSVSQRDAGGGALADLVGVEHTLTTALVRYASTMTLNNASTAFLRAKFLGPASATAQTWYLDKTQLERKPYATSFARSDMGLGYSLSGGGTHLRAASSASISPAGIFDTYLGAIVFVATPTIETGAEEIWGELGEKLAGADHIRWGRDSTKHPFVEWSGNDSAYTRVTLTATVDAGDEHFYSIEWHVGDADFRLYLDDDPSENDTIPSPQEDYGAGPLKLQATAGGVIYGGLAICSERLTNDQRARLKVVMENRGNIETALDSKRGRYGFFQVRPKVE